jgi:hypothetical protein
MTPPYITQLIVPHPSRRKSVDIVSNSLGRMREQHMLESCFVGFVEFHVLSYLLRKWKRRAAQMMYVPTLPHQYDLG